ncbi:hypothetical protein MNB_SV-6-509 [hydrothermal vent metagenome]|uniref:Uncharacterized protein n=1 Tax=hydrothermal vent metagenome TaxID=652676 RepID=A0A1W1CAC9_9ZZZZ
MTSKDMDQIRELLIGEFVRNTKSKFELIESRLDELQEDNLRNVNALSKNISAKIEQLQQNSKSNYEYLENLLEAKLKESKSLNQNEFNNIKSDIEAQKEFTSKSLATLKKIFDAKLKTMIDEMDAKSVSRASLSSMFLEHSLKLKGSDIEDEMQNMFQNSKTDSK